ncbi:TrkH family potassium uptake protein [Euzebya sp.]|uniref:TrkH family potassium uptake protein n=1 Tax=Euzebya sp. TaxID=1971409 RepID=UPI003514719A
MTLAFRPGRRDLSTVALLVSRAVLVVSAAMLVPAALGFATGEVDSAVALTFGACLGISTGALADLLLPPAGEIRWGEGMVASGLTWLVCPLFCAVPLYLSGHFGSFLQAYFDAMSALSCTGLSVLHDLDHLADSMNLWRHLMQFLGGQGIVLVVLTFFAGGGGAVGMYAGEAREDKILPNVRRTAQFIWRASLVYFLIGSTALTVALQAGGMRVTSAAFHAVNLFFAAFDTGGFSPRSSSIGYYHSAAVEAVLIVLMVAGAVSFAVHYRLWQGDGRELLRNIEMRVLAVTSTGVFAMLAFGLIGEGVYADGVAAFRRAIFQLVSAHTGAGFASVPSAVFSSGWGAMAPVALVVAMGIGGMSGSTAGGIKAIRLGLTAKMVELVARQPSLPPDAYLVTGYHHLQRQRFRPDAARAALVVLLLFIALYVAGTAAGLYHGHPLTESLFESTSAAAGVGLSTGIASPSMPSTLMVTYISQMYLGRLEFLSALALFGYVGAMVRGRV